MKVISKMICKNFRNNLHLENRIDNSMIHIKDDLFLLDNKYEILSAKVDTMYDKINDIEKCFDTTISDYNKYFENRVNNNKISIGKMYHIFEEYKKENRNLAINMYKMYKLINSNTYPNDFQTMRSNLCHLGKRKLDYFLACVCNSGESKQLLSIDCIFEKYFNISFSKEELSSNQELLKIVKDVSTEIKELKILQDFNVNKEDFVFNSPYQ
jgi:hypothetical protein